MKKDQKIWKEKLKVETEEKDFYHKQALDAKRKNKLLKVAIGRLQVEREVSPPKQINEQEDGGDFFLTEAVVKNKKIYDYDNLENSAALVEQNINESMMAKKKPLLKDKSHFHKRTYSQGGHFSGVSRYSNIPSENLKFQ